MQTLWIDGQLRQVTPRQELRLALRAGCTMNRAEMNRHRSLMSEPAFHRFERLWAVSTATEHPLTRAWPLPRWSARRDRIRRAVRAFLAS
jgi:hypothetical protein